ncbi:MAG TPA: cytochrome P450 [Acidimicrobiales bacterium]|nr:cytochrome P450 [Acidimicrobiales bacterium]
MAVEELLRWVSPVKNMSRTVTADVELRGQRLREGDQVMLFYPSANRDEGVFEAPDCSTSAATPTRTSRSASARTTASAPRSPAWSSG